MHRGTFAWRGVSCARTVLSVSLLLALSAWSATVWGQTSDATIAGALRTYPLTSDTVSVVSNATPATAGEAEKVLYDNPLGRTIAEIPAQALISDDIKLAVATGCALRRYKVQVIGKANPNACGGPGISCGPVRIDFGLYNECPGAGGVPIDGTLGCVTNAPDAYPDCLVMNSEFAVTEVEFVPSQAVSLPSAVWLGVKASRAYTGVVIGAPALTGYSGDIFDTFDFPCSASAGGFPAQPHASFHASIYGAATCPDTCLVYQNIRSSEGGINAGANNCIADDIQLDNTCQLAEMEVGLRGAGTYDIELRRNRGGLPEGDCVGGAASMSGPAAIPGTHRRFLVPQSGLTVKRFTFDPPIQLPSTQLFAVLVPDNINATWILTGRSATVGATSTGYVEWSGESWWGDLPATGVHGGMQITLTCADACPLGACCDQYFRDENNEAVCRDVPHINCPFPPWETELVPAWKEGVSCRVCDGGDSDGLACRADEDCGDSGTCVENDPFLLPCGVSACCTVEGDCFNVTSNQCKSWSYPVPGPGNWEAGRFCGRYGQSCAVPSQVCLSADGDCLSPKPYTCVGGTNDGKPCTWDGDCPSFDNGSCQNIMLRCVGGDHDGMECRSDLDCIPGGSCAYSVCVGGAHDGERCTYSTDCRESYCDGTSPGCSDYDCCLNVCEYVSPPLGDSYYAYCCTSHWDANCADLARQLGCAPGPVCKPGAIDADEPPDGTIDAGWAIDCNDGGDVQGIHVLDVYGPPGSADPSCWSLCESSTAGAPNTIEQVVEYEPAHYRITLSRPITPGQCTSLVYNAQSGSPSTLTYAALPGDVDGNGTTNGQDILAIIDILNGAMQPPWGNYSADVDRSGDTNATDVLAVIDLLRGAGACTSWNNVSLPEGCGQCPDLPAP